MRALVVIVAILMLTVVFAGMGSASNAGSSLGPVGTPTGATRDLLLRTTAASDRTLLSTVGATTVVDYGGFVLASVPENAMAFLTSRGVVLRDLSDRTMVLMGSVQFDTRRGEPDIPADLRIAGYAPGEAGLYIVQFVGPIQGPWVLQARDLGAQFLNYIPNFAFIAQMTPETASALRSLSVVQWVGIYQPAYRISHLVYEQFPEAAALTAGVPGGALVATGSSVAASLSKVRLGSGSLRGSIALPSADMSRYDISVLILKTAPASAFRELASLTDAYYQSMDVGRLRLLRFSTEAGNLARIANIPGVYWVEPYVRPVLYDEISSQISAGNINPLAPGYSAWLAGLGLSGAGVTVAVDDTGIDTGIDDLNVTGDMHPELDNRVVANLYYGSLSDASDGYGHGTHSAGIVGADGSLGMDDADGYNYGLGIAPEAYLVNQRIFDSSGGFVSPDFVELATDAFNHGASINSNSWGTSDYGQYIIDDMIYDGLVRDADPSTAGNQQLTFEFSSGNAGWGGGVPSYGTTGSPGNAKNTITTGASLNYRPTIPPPGTWPADNIDASAGFSSRGPTADGRIKPDITAPGTWISSLLSSVASPGWCWANIDTYHEYCGGTSMAGPMVSGAAALFVEYYRSLMAADPSPALTKAVLVNGAVDMPPTTASEGSFSTAPIPNMDEGWGRLNIANVVAFPGVTFYDDQTHSLNTGESYSKQIAVGLTSQPFKVSLAWTDIPGTPGAATELVNDLDLVVTAPDGTTYLGNQFVDGWSTTGGAPDAKNNLENVYIAPSDIQLGLYTITVLGVNVPTGPQDFALVATYAGGPTADGVVQFGRLTYQSSAVADIILMDTDLNLNPAAPDTASVFVVSDAADNETVALTEVGSDSAVFTGSIQLTLTASGLNDGVLTVVNNGQISIIYVEASPPGIKNAYATIDDNPPVITNVGATNLAEDAATIVWTTDEPSTSVVRYGRITPPANSASGFSGVDHSVRLTGLLPSRTYYFEVESTDAAGNTAVDDNSGAWYSFVTLSKPAILLVDNDYGYAYETYYQSALTALGYNFDTWEIYTAGEPPLSVLQPYFIVIWFRPTGTIATASQTTMEQYLDAGGRMIVVGQDLGYYSSSTPWYTNYLHATYVQDDPFTRDLVGVAGDVIGNGLSFSISGGDGANDNYYPDVVDPRTPAVTGIQYVSGSGTRTALLHVDTGVYRLVYLPFNYEGISTAADRELLMDRMLHWLLPAYGVKLIPASQAGIAAAGQTVTYSLDVQNVGFADPQDTFNLEWNSAPLGWTASLFYENMTGVIDTNGDGTPDTGPILSGAMVTMYVQVAVDPAAIGGQEDTATINVTSVASASATSQAVISTLVPPPGVELGTGPYVAVVPDQTVIAPMTVMNAGGTPDVINLAASSRNGWATTLLAADGVTPLTDSNSDGLVDVGTLGGLVSAAFTVQIVVPAGVTPNTIDLVDVVGSSAADVTATDASPIVLEYFGPGPSDWPTFHNTGARRGASPNVFDPPLFENWTAYYSYSSLWTSPVLDNGILFSTALDGSITARNPFSGEVLWKKILGGSTYYVGTPTAANGVVYATFDTGSTSGVYALDEMTGVTLWSTTSPSPFYNARLAMAHDAGMVFGGTWSGAVFALNATTGEVVWSTPTGFLPFGGATATAGLVWVPVVDTALSVGYVYAFNEATGEIAWTAPLNGIAVAPPLFAQGKIYEGTAAGTMYALDAFTGSVEWTAGGYGMIDYSTPAYDGTNIYFGAYDPGFHALNATTGARVWDTSAMGAVDDSIAYANGYLYGTTQYGYLYVLEAATGAIEEMHALSMGFSTSSPAIGNGWIWVDDFDQFSGQGYLYAFAAEGAGVAMGIAAEPDTATVAAGGAVLFAARAHDAFGNPVPGGPFVWSTEGTLGSILPTSAMASQAVYVAGPDVGTDTLTVTFGDLTDTATVEIIPGGLYHVAITPGTATVSAGGTQSFSAQALDRYGNVISGVAVSWSTSGGIGTVNAASGAFTAGTHPAVGLVNATSGSETGSAVVTVVPGPVATVAVNPATVSMTAGGTQLLQGTAYDQYSNVVPGTTCTWSTTIGAVMPATGDLVTLSGGTTAGTGTVTLTVGSATGTVPVTVTPGPLAHVSLSPGSASVAAGGTQTFTVSGTDAFGNAVTGLTPSWSVSSGLGTISSAGAWTAATTVGTGTVTVTVGAVSASVPVTIVPGALATITADETSLSLLTGGTHVITAIAADAHGNRITGAQLTWSAASGTVTPSADGSWAVYTAGGAAGSDTITVSSGSVSDTVTVTVSASSIPIDQQLTQPMSLLLLVLVIALAAIAVVLFVLYRRAKASGGSRPEAPPPDEPPQP